MILSALVLGVFWPAFSKKHKSLSFFCTRPDVSLKNDNEEKAVQQKYFLSHHHSGFHRVAYMEWNKNHKDRVVLCVHGLTRNGRDFDVLAEALQEDFRVICVDLPGRGKSDWLPGPECYGFYSYIDTLTTLIARLDVESVDWIGSSMGGGLGIVMASMASSPIQKLILNDCTPIFEPTGNGGVQAFSGKVRTFENLDTVEAYLRKVYATLAPMTDDQWQHLAKHSVFFSDDGFYRLNYDPTFFQAPHIPRSDEERLAAWEKIICPIYLMRGCKSDLVTPRVVEISKKTQPKMKVVDILEAGHTPSLNDDFQIKTIRKWLME